MIIMKIIIIIIILELLVSEDLILKTNTNLSTTLNAKIFGRFNFRTITYGPKILVSEKLWGYIESL